MSHQWDKNFLDEVEDRFGIDVAEKLRSDFGGGSLYIPWPKNLKPSSKLAHSLGFPLALKVSKELTVNKSGFGVRFRASERSVRNQVTKLQNEIDDLIRQGFNAAEIVRDLGCTERTVYRRKALMRATDTKLEAKTRDLIMEIRDLLLRGETVASVAKTTKAKKIAVLFHKHALIKEGKLNADQ